LRLKRAHSKYILFQTENLDIVSFLDSDKMKQNEKVPPLSKYFPEKLCFFIFCKKGKMKISIGGPNRARVLFEGNLPTGLDYLFNLNDVFSPRSAILTLTHKNNRRKKGFSEKSN